MADVLFTANELRARDEILADRLEGEIREAASQFADPEPIQCRILVEMGFEPASSRIRIQFERPGWVKSFGLPAEAAIEDVRRAAGVILRNE
jgi:hypothetical protein